MLAALAGVVHYRQSADGDNNRDNGNHKWSLHIGLARPATHRLKFRGSNMNPQ
jgi:hypothetical protein